MTENKIYISTDHKTFCLKHRSHSVSYSCCPDCFEGIKEELSQAKKEAEEWKSAALSMGENLANPYDKRKEK